MKKIWVNGCFDIIHRGHIELFKYAKSLGDFLIVGLDTDSRISGNKGDNRPINKLEDRIFVLQSIKFVDSVVSFDTDEELEKQIEAAKPDIMVVGSDWINKKNNLYYVVHILEKRFKRKDYSREEIKKIVKKLYYTCQRKF